MIQIQDLPHALETGKRPKGGATTEGVPSVGAENVKALGILIFLLPNSFLMILPYL